MDKSTPRPTECEHPDEMQAIVRTAAESGIYCRRCGNRIGDAPEPASAPTSVNRDAAFDALVEALRRIDGGLITRSDGTPDPDAPSIDLPPHEFRAAMWSWSQRVARAALALATKE